MRFWTAAFWRIWSARLVFAASAFLVVRAVTTTAQLPPVHTLHDLHFFDLRVYRQAARVANHGHPLYAAKFGRHGMGFTYPPFAALVLVPLTWLSLHGAEIAITLISVALTALAVHAALRLPHPASGGREVRIATHPAAAWLAAAVALWTQPVSTAIGLGQIDVVIAALVIIDLAYGRGTRLGGVGIGLAAALKLTPLIFIPYLALTRQSRMAGRALVTFALSILVAFAVVPADARSFWTQKLLDFTRVSGSGRHSGGGPGNQSLRGALMRLLPNDVHVSVVWIVVCLLICVFGMLLAVRASRRGDGMWGFLLTAITGLLISPVSWSHHWTIAVPGVLALVICTRGANARLLAAGVALAFAIGGYAIWLTTVLSPFGTDLNAAGLLVGDLYVIGGLGMLAFAAVRELLAVRRARGVRPVASHTGADRRLPGTHQKPVTHPLPARLNL